MTTYTLEDLLSPRSADAIFADRVAYLAANGVTLSPSRFNAPRLLLRACCELAARWESLCADIARGGYLDLAEGLWLTLKAESDYRITRTPAQFGTVRATLTVASGAGPYTFGAGELVLQRANGQRYVVQGSGGTLSSAAASTLDFRATDPGSLYNLSPGEVLTLASALPGVTVAQVSALTLLAQTGSGPAVGGSTSLTGLGLVYVKIEAGGALGVATFRFSSDGSTWSTARTTAATYGSFSGYTLTFDGGTYVAGEVYTLQATGNGMVQPGVDEEDDAALAQRCRDRWPLLGRYLTLDGIAALARAAVPGRLTSVYPVSRAAGPGTVYVHLVEDGAPCSAVTLDTVQDVMKRSAAPEAHVRCYAAIAQNVTLTGTVTCDAGSAAATRVAIRKALYQLQRKQQVGGTLQLADLYAALRPLSGVRNVVLTAPLADVTSAAPDFPRLSCPDAPSGGSFDVSGLTIVEV